MDPGDLVLRGGRILDPAAGKPLDVAGDIRISNGRIIEIGKGLTGGRIIDVTDLWVVPGLIDLHVHLREPGQEYKEDIETGTRAAAAGGFTTICCMPNTKPVNDNAGVTELILKKAADANLARVYPIGAVSRGQQGEQLADIAELKQAGCVAITDDGHPVSTALLARRAMEYGSMFGLPLIEHCEDPSLKGDGVAHEGPVAASLGLKGIPGIAEAITAGRDILIAEMVGGHIHVAHMSAWTTLEAVRQGKSRGVKVTCEVAPHHFTLTDALLAAPVPYDTDTKMNQPLREQRDVDAMLAGIADGSVDVIATDHAPHHADEKNVEFDRAPFGIVGLETAIPIVLDKLVHAGVIRLPRLVEMMSVNPAAILKVPGGSLKEGAVADITILAPDQSVTIDRAALVSKSHNTPYHGWTFRGAAAATIVGGRVVYANPASGIALTAEGR